MYAVQDKAVYHPVHLRSNDVLCQDLEKHAPMPPFDVFLERYNFADSPAVIES